MHVNMPPGMRDEDWIRFAGRVGDHNTHEVNLNRRKMMILRSFTPSKMYILPLIMQKQYEFSYVKARDMFGL
jgi:hypothetical protein